MKTAIGLMSGTSMDGIDVALVHTDGQQEVEFGPSIAFEYDEPFRKRIEEGLQHAVAINHREERPGELEMLEEAITQRHGEVVGRFLADHELKTSDIDVIGFHGQTVLHRPGDALTVQLGRGDALAAATGIDVVYDMRAADMVAGGQGAPLVPVFHQALSRSVAQDLPVCFVNIGGISNITYVDDDNLIAFDTGPGNALIDQWMQSRGGKAYDLGGETGLSGVVLSDVAARYMASPYFSKNLPKSLDRNDFSPLIDEKIQLQDGARTLARVAACSIIKATEHLPAAPKSWIIAGGGRLNGAIMSDLRELADDGASVVLAEDAGLAGDMLEAQAFAYLAVRSLQGLPLTFPATTGCESPVTGGVLSKAA